MYYQDEESGSAAPSSSPESKSEVRSETEAESHGPCGPVISENQQKEIGITEEKIEAPAIRTSNNQDSVFEKISKIQYPKELLVNYPHDTLVVNPLDPMIPFDQKVSADWAHPISHEFYVWIRFLGACRQSGDTAGGNHMIYQIAVMQIDEKDYQRGRADYMTDPCHIIGTDIGIGLDAMERTIQKSLIPQAHQIVVADIKRYLIDIKMKKKNTKRPWGTVPSAHAEKMLRSRTPYMKSARHAFILPQGLGLDLKGDSKIGKKI